MTSSESSEDSECGETVRRNISLQSDDAEMFEDLADEHYNGNISQLIRAAVRDHKQSLEGDDLYALKSLDARLGLLFEEVIEIHDLIEGVGGDVLNIDASIDDRSALLDTNQQSTPSAESYKVSRDLLRPLNGFDGPTTIEDLASEVKYSNGEVRAGLTHLVDSGHVNRIERTNDDDQYKLTKV